MGKTTVSAGDGKSKSSGAKCKAQVHFITYIDILGPKLGTECTATKAVSLQQIGTLERRMPKILVRKAREGFAGIRPEWQAADRRLGREQEPNQGHSQAVGKFLSHPKDFPQGGISALEADTLTLADLKKLAK